MDNVFFRGVYMIWIWFKILRADVIDCGLESIDLRSARRFIKKNFISFDTFKNW